jgi:hypothetical protein
LSWSENWAVQDLNQKSQPAADKGLIKNQHKPKVQNQVHLLTIHPDLANLVTVWPGLPEHIKAAIKALIQTNSTEKK